MAQSVRRSVCSLCAHDSAIYIPVWLLAVLQKDPDNQLKKQNGPSIWMLCVVSGVADSAPFRTPCNGHGKLSLNPDVVTTGSIYRPLLKLGLAIWRKPPG